MSEKIEEILEDVKRHIDYLDATNQSSIRDNEMRVMYYEIERLQHNAEVSTKWEMELTRENTKLKEETKRLNNIISKLEKWLKSESNYWKERQENAMKNGWLEFGGKYNTTIIYDNAINKLQELKGSDKE